VGHAADLGEQGAAAEPVERIVVGQGEGGFDRGQDGLADLAEDLLAIGLTERDETLGGGDQVRCRAVEPGGEAGLECDVVGGEQDGRGDGIGEVFVLDRGEQSGELAAPWAVASSRRSKLVWVAAARSATSCSRAASPSRAARQAWTNSTTSVRKAPCAMRVAIHSAVVARSRTWPASTAHSSPLEWAKAPIGQLGDIQVIRS
jgi:hypothetical protein